MDASSIRYTQGSFQTVDPGQSSSKSPQGITPQPPPVADTVKIITTNTFNDIGLSFGKITRRSGKTETKIEGHQPSSSSQVQKVAGEILTSHKEGYTKTTVRDTGISAHSLKAASEIFKEHMAGVNSFKTLSFKKGDDEFLIANGKLFYIHPKTIAEGSFGAVKSVYNISQGCFELIKVVKNPTPRSTAEVQKEAEMLHYLHRNGQSSHLHDPPVAVTHLTPVAREFVAGSEVDVHSNYFEETSSILGMVVPEYSMDAAGKLSNLEDWMISSPPPSFEERLEVCRQITLAVSELHRAGVHHGDIKLGNFVIYRDERGKLKVKLIDFGSAEKLAQSDTSISPYALGGHTPSMTAEQDVTRLQAIIHRQDTALFNDYAFRRDIFAIGITMYQILSGGEYPPFQYVQFDNGRYYPSQVDQELLAFKLGQCLGPNPDLGKAAVLIAMLSPNFLERPSIDEASEFLASLRSAFATPP